MNISMFEKIKIHLTQKQYTWLVTGAAGFIGSNLVELLLKLNQRVIGIDNLSTNSNANLVHLCDSISEPQVNNFQFFEMDIRAIECKKIIKDIDFVLHHAALASVPESISKPELTNSVNVDGFLNILCAAKEAGVKRFVYASSSSVYGDVTEFPINGI